ENRASKFCYRCCDCLTVRLSIGARLVIAPDRENRKVDSQPDQNRAETDADHAESPEKELPESQSNQAGEQKANSHAQKRKPTAKTHKKNCAYQEHRAKQRGHDVVTHAQRDFRCKSRAPGDQHSQRAAIPSLGRDYAKFVYFAHQSLAFESAD